MKSIFKYPLMVADYQTVALPEGARILCVQNQRDRLYLWAIVNPDPSALKEARGFRLIGTGHKFEEIELPHLHYIGTAQQADILVWHVFEVRLNTDPQQFPNGQAMLKHMAVATVSENHK